MHMIQWSVKIVECTGSNSLLRACICMCTRAENIQSLKSKNWKKLQKICVCVSEYDYQPPYANYGLLCTS